MADAPMGLVAAAGEPPEETPVLGVAFEEQHRGRTDPVDVHQIDTASLRGG